MSKVPNENQGVVMEHTTEMYEGLACCECGWSGFPEEVTAHKAEADG
jgi:hypothetical protein